MQFVQYVKETPLFALRGARPVGLERVYSPLISLATYARGLLSGISPRSIWRATCCISFALTSPNSEQITAYYCEKTRPNKRNDYTSICDNIHKIIELFHNYI